MQCRFRFILKLISNTPTMARSLKYLIFLAVVACWCTVEVNSEWVKMTLANGTEEETTGIFQGTKEFFTDSRQNGLYAWYESMEYCQQNGGEPGRVESAAENQFVARYLQDNFSSSHVFWLGASDWGQDGRFYWIRTGQNIQYSNFASGYPNGGPGESCIYVWGDQLWYDQYCFVTDVRPLCQRFI